MSVTACHNPQITTDLSMKAKSFPPCARACCDDYIGTAEAELPPNKSQSALVARIPHMNHEKGTGDDECLLSLEQRIIRL